ncbi:hypothetical protein BGX27_006109 [Mortierella sp. AM989]|nr:hypothetical protein BGX27_006109 [Mortierella sp. AM989]
MGFFFGFLCGLLFIPLSILAGLYYFFTYSESYAKKRQREIDEVKLKELELRNELEDAAQYASYLSSTHNQTGNSAHGGSGAVPEHLDPHYQFAGWISVRRIPEVDHRIIEPSAKKETKRSLGKNGKGSSSSLMDDGNYGQGVGVGAATQDPRLAYLDTQNLHLTLPPCLQARFKDSKYGVIKGSVMFIYDNEHLHECLGVITLTNYEISVPGHPTDGHMFAKRYPIWLKYQHISHHSSHQGRNSTDSGTNSSKDYYLSMVNCVDKEDLYFTLLRCSKLKPNSRSFLREIPKRDSTQFDKSNMNTLIRSIHSNEHQFHMAWLNALLGRIFLGVYKTPKIKDAIYQKLVDKLSRIRLPNFVNHLRLKSVHLGDGVPMITRPKLLSLKPNGDMVMDMNLLYQGGFRAEIEAEAVVAVTKKMPIKVSLVLVVTLDRLEGRLQAWIKPPPSNRIWYGFYHRPQVEMKIEPVVSDKHIKSNLIIKAIENKLMEAISETFVLPNMDDVSFFDSDGIGGIFGEEISPGGEPKQATTQPGAKTQSNNHNLEPRAATFSLGDSVNTPRSAIDLSSDLRHHETMPAGLYRVPLAARSHGSLGDEIMQANYTYDVRNKTGLSPDDDPMRSGTPKVGQTSDNAGPKTLHVPGSRGIKVNTDQGPKSQDQESPNSCNNRLLNRMYHSNTAELKRGRRGSLDPNVNLSYSTATPAGNNPNSAHFPAMDEARKMEEHWSQYGISEYDPLAGQKKKVKGKGSDSPDGDHASVHSKDSGDSGSTHTENTGHSSTLFGHSNSSHSTFDTNSMSHSSKPDKFSLTKMFNGFRKKHTKGANSGSSLQPSIGEFGVYQDDGHEGGSILAGDDESTIQEHDGSIYTPPEQDDPRPSEHLAENLQSGDDIEAQASFADKVQEEYEKRDSPPPFVYAASLFGDEAPHHGKLSPTQSNQNSLSNFGTAIRNLRNRSRASSASSREGLSILSEDSDVVFGHDLSHQTRGLTEADSSSQIGLQTTDGIDDRAITERSGSDEYPNGQSLEEPELPSIYESPLVEKEQLTRDSRRKSISVPKLQSGFDYPGQSASARMTATPLIVLQMPSPHGDKLFDTDGYYGV